MNETYTEKSDFKSNIKNGSTKTANYFTSYDLMSTLKTTRSRDPIILESKKLW